MNLQLLLGIHKWVEHIHSVVNVNSNFIKCCEQESPKISPTESTLDPPYGEIQEIYEKKAKDAKVNDLKLNNKISDIEHS